MQRFKQPNMDLHPDGEWIRYEDHVEAMKHIAGEAERCKCCGYLVTESEHRGCLRAAAPSANGQQAKPVENHSRVCLNGAQLLEALDFIAPDRDTDCEQLESEVTIQYGGGHDGAGYYCWVSDYPEEGAILLDGEGASSILAAPAPSGSPAYKDSTPHLRVGDSSFESWYEQKCASGWSGQKQLARDAYAAGMGDPLVMARASASPAKQKR